MDFDNSRPIYIQLLEDFKIKISGNEWKAGQKIDTVRNLAQSYGVNPNTVQRALQELEREGLARSNRTAGRFVTDDEVLIKKLANSAFYKACDGLIDVANQLEIKKEDSINMLKNYWKEGETNE
ncbi:DNA-binding transcriptional regulator YhcF (GntR family) [Peptoniphilus olsenii]|uniref:DNA-binding transcriptional regulator YhcF (GntR family) n=1 Tax=Peptoniphilus olsenii TaxID=411570 RepID=A0ABV2JB83_9FIRM